MIDENKMNVIGNIEGLRKGNLYLQKVDNGLIINVDSVKIEGNSKYPKSNWLQRTKMPLRGFIND